MLFFLFIEAGGKISTPVVLLLKIVDVLSNSPTKGFRYPISYITYRTSHEKEEEP